MILLLSWLFFACDGSSGGESSPSDETGGECLVDCG